MVNREFGGRYKILEKIGSGGMAHVYKGEDKVLNRTVAIKILHDQFVHDESFVARFKQEAQSAANLTHPNIVNIFDWGQEGDSYYIIMEYLNGQNLRDYIKDAGHLTWQEACDIALQTANALSFAHKNDVVHRDIKPHNIIVTRDGSVKVTDFGIARAGSSHLTQTGAILGTAHYISPEQASGQNADARSDLYSLGIVFFEMLTGQLPYTGDNPVTIAMKHIQENVPPIRSINPNIPDSVVSILNKALAKDPQERYGNASEIKQDLALAMKGVPVKAQVGSEQDTIVMRAKPRNTRSIARTRLKKRKKKKIWPIATLIAVIVIAAIGWVLMSSTIGKRIEVPDLSGLSLSRAKATLKKKNLSLEVGLREYSDTVKKGLIIEQNPEAGFTVKEGGFVQVVVSKGVETTIVPRLYGKTRSEAEVALTQKGLNLGDIQYKESTSVAGTVISQGKKAGLEVKRDSSIDIVLSKEIEKVTIPSVIGRSRKNALVILATKKLKGSVVERYDDDIDKGLVVSQTPSAGGTVEKNSTVTIYVSKGPQIKKVSVPSVVGMSLADATNTIQGANLKIGSSGTGATVQSQDPAAGTSIDEGSTVSVVLGD